MLDDYEIEDSIMASCHHPSSFIIHERMCDECGKTLESEVINPGTETLTACGKPPTSREAAAVACVFSYKTCRTPLLRPPYWSVAWLVGSRWYQWNKRVRPATLAQWLCGGVDSRCLSERSEHEQAAFNRPIVGDEICVRIG